MAAIKSERPWWARSDDLIEDEDPIAHDRLRTMMFDLDRYQSRTSNLEVWGSIYIGRKMTIASALASNRVYTGFGDANGRLSLNVSRNVVDAVVSRICSKSKPKLTYTTEGGDYEKQHNAEKLTLGVDGIFYRTDFYNKATAASRDGFIFGTGWLRIVPNWDRWDIDVEVWRPWEQQFDQTESIYGEPRCNYTKRYYDKFVLSHRVRMGWMGKGTQSELDHKAEMVERISDPIDQDMSYSGQIVGQHVRVWEAWHKPSGKDAKDGRHVIAVSNCTLVDEPWDGGPDGWEFVQFGWSKPTAGFYGEGIIEIGAGLQIEINKLIREIQCGHHLITGKWLVEQNSKVVTAQINNDLSSILRYMGTPPTYVAPAIIAPEVYQHLWNLVQKYYELSGVNQQSAQAQKPAGLDSGEAQRVYADQQTETLLEKGEMFESAVKRCGQLSVDAAKALSKEGAYEVRAMADDAFETIDWKTLEDPDGYELKVFPTSQLPGTPSGKISLAQDLLALGVYTPIDVMSIIGMPDTMQTNRRILASRSLVEKKVGEMLRNGTPYQPHSLLKFDEAIKLATDMCNEAEEKGVSQDKLQVVRDFIVKTNMLKNKPPEPQAAPASGLPGVELPGAPPGPALGPVGPQMPPGPQGPSQSPVSQAA
jgi:hypothetical protein